MMFFCEAGPAQSRVTFFALGGNLRSIAAQLDTRAPGSSRDPREVLRYAGQDVRFVCTQLVCSSVVSVGEASGFGLLRPVALVHCG